MNFLQEASSSSRVLKARNMISSLRSGAKGKDATLALLEFSLKAKKVDFSKILAQIDGMVKVLGEEQKEDEETKAFCSAELDKSETSKADTEEAISQSEASIEEMTEESSTLATG